MRREKFTLVFELPDEAPLPTVDQIGTRIEDMMNAEFPGIYMDVIWRTWGEVTR